LVTVTGSDFVNSAALMCKFGTNTAVATFATASTASCRSPAAPAPASVAVTVSNNNADYTVTSATFNYDCASTGCS
jgi:hypothetical protein